MWAQGGYPVANPTELASSSADQSQPNELLTVQGTNGIEPTAVGAAMEELVSLVRQYCGGEVSWSILDRDHPWAVME